MGNICNQLDNEGKLHCIKCKDKYKPHYGGLSHRTSCRCHNYIVKNNKYYCLDCRKTKNEIRSRNCYHSRRY